MELGRQQIGWQSERLSPKVHRRASVAYGAGDGAVTGPRKSRQVVGMTPCRAMASFAAHCVCGRVVDRVDLTKITAPLNYNGVCAAARLDHNIVQACELNLAPVHLNSECTDPSIGLQYTVRE